MGGSFGLVRRVWAFGSFVCVIIFTGGDVVSLYSYMEGKGIPERYDESEEEEEKDD